PCSVAVAASTSLTSGLSGKSGAAWPSENRAALGRKEPRYQWISGRLRTLRCEAFAAGQAVPHFPERPLDALRGADANLPRAELLGEVARRAVGLGPTLVEAPALRTVRPADCPPLRQRAAGMERTPRRRADEARGVTLGRRAIGSLL